MFDLFRSREKSVRYLLGALLVLVAASMVITLVPGYGGGWGAGGADPSILAEVGDHLITTAEVRKVIQREMKGRIPEGMASIYIPAVVQQLVAARATAVQAERMGIRLTDEQLAQLVRSYVPQLWEGGTFAGKEAYSQYLAQQDLTIPEFEEALRTQAIQSRLDVLTLEGLIVTPQELEEEFRRKNESVKVAYFGITPDAMTSKAAVSQAEVEAYFAQHRASYRAPERRSYVIFPVEEQQIAASLKIPGEQIRLAYNQQQERFRTPERVKARHILLKTVDKPAAEVAAIQKRAEDLLKQIKGGANFAELAKKNSEDPGSGAKGGDLDWIVRGQTVAEFEKTAFSLKRGETSDLVKTQYGFHIIQVLDHEQARLRPFEEVKAELAAEVGRAQVYDKMQRLADQIRSALVRSRDEAEKIARDNGIPAVKSDNVAAGDPIQEVGVNEQFNSATQGLPVNGVTPVVQIGQNKLVVAQVTAIVSSRPAALSEVEKQVRGALIAQKAAEMAQKLASAIEGKMKSGESDLAKLARDAGASVRTSDFVTRSSSIEGMGSAGLIEEAYSREPGAVMGPVRSGNAAFFVKVIEKRPADMTQFAAQRSSLLEELKRQRARERNDLFRDGIVQELTRKKKVKIYEDNVKRFVSAYAS